MEEVSLPFRCHITDNGEVTVTCITSNGETTRYYCLVASQKDE